MIDWVNLSIQAHLLALSMVKIEYPFFLLPICRYDDSRFFD